MQLRLFFLLILGCCTPLFSSQAKEESPERRAAWLPILLPRVTSVISPYTSSIGNTSGWQGLRYHYPQHSDLALQGIASAMHAHMYDDKKDLPGKIKILQQQIGDLESGYKMPTTTTELSDPLHESNVNIAQALVPLYHKRDALLVLLHNAEKTAWPVPQTNG